MFAPFLKSFVATTLLSLAAAASVLAWTGPDLPAPHLSRSASFNEKARWLRTALSARRCDTLVIGSSMSLNSLDSEQLASGGGKVINLASFGVNPEDTVELLKIVLPLCRPKAVIMASYHGDFANSMPEEKGIAWGQVSAYLRGGSPLRAYAADPDLYYLLKRSFRTAELHRTDTYESVAFGPAGGVGLDCRGFHRESGRWNADLSDKLPPPRAAALAAIGEVARMTRAAGASLVVAVVPLRPRAEHGFYPAERAALWRAVAREIAPAGGILVRPAGNATFTDPEFADFAHLNRCGAQRWTAMVISATKGTER